MQLTSCQAAKAKICCSVIGQVDSTIPIWFAIEYTRVTHFLSVGIQNLRIRNACKSHWACLNIYLSLRIPVHTLDAVDGF
jgi:hypothetical protein